MLVGFGLGWIPYVSILGGLFTLVGIGFMWFGREDYRYPHPRNVVAGGVLFVVAFLLTVGLTIWFAAAIVGAANTSGQTSSQVGSIFTGDLLTLLVGDVVAAILILFAEVLIVYALADPVARRVLWVAVAAQVVISTFLVIIVYPSVSGAVQQATSGSTIDLGPVTALQTRILIYSLMNAIPSLMFAYAYYRTRERLKPEFVPLGTHST